MTLSSKKYLTAVVITIVYIEEVSALIVQVCVVELYEKRLVWIVFTKSFTLRRLPLWLSLLVTRMLLRWTWHCAKILKWNYRKTRN